MLGHMIRRYGPTTILIVIADVPHRADHRPGGARLMDGAKRDPLDQIRSILPGSASTSNASVAKIKHRLREAVLGHMLDAAMR